MCLETLHQVVLKVWNNLTHRNYCLDKQTIYFKLNAMSNGLKIGIEMSGVGKLNIEFFIWRLSCEAPHNKA